MTENRYVVKNIVLINLSVTVELICHKSMYLSRVSHLRSLNRIDLDELILNPIILHAVAIWIYQVVLYLEQNNYHR